MENDRLDALERDLAAVSGRLAAERPWDPRAPRVRWTLLGPVRGLLWTTLLIAAALVLGWHDGHSWMLGVGLAILVLPGRWDAARARRRTLAGAGRADLFALYREELEQRSSGIFVRLLFDAGLIGALLLLALALPDPRPSLAVAGLFLLDGSVQAFVFWPRVRRERAALGPDDEDREDEGEEEEDDEGVDESWPSLLAGLALRFMSVFVLYVGPPLVALFLILAALGGDRGRALVLAGTLAAAWLIVWYFVAGDEQGDS